MRGRKAIFLKFGTALLSIVITLAILELAARVLGSPPLLIYSVAQPDPPYYVYDAELGWDLKPNLPATNYRVDGVKYKVWTNEIGCYDVPYGNEEEYILLVGDSFSFHHTGLENKWGKVAEKKLGKRVLNCGVGGYGVKQDLMKAKRIVSRIGKPPSVIVVGYFLNDLDDDFTFTSAMQKFASGAPPPELSKKEKITPFLLKTKDWFFRNSAFYRIARTPIESLLSKTPLGKKLTTSGVIHTDISAAGAFSAYFNVEAGEAYRQTWQQQLNVFHEFKQLAEDQGSRIVFVLIPWKFQVYDFLLSQNKNFMIPKEYQFSQKEYISYPNKLLHEALEREGIPYIDMLSLREYADLTPRKNLDTEKDLYFKFDGHWSPKGNELAGILTAKYILENNILQTEGKEAKLQEIEKELKERYR